MFPSYFSLFNVVEDESEWVRTKAGETEYFVLKPRDNTEEVAMKGVGIIDADPKTVLAWHWDHASRRNVDLHARENTKNKRCFPRTVIEVINSHTEICWTVYATPAPFSDREFVIKQNWGWDEGKETM